MVRNPGTASEAVTDMTSGTTAHAMQGALERLKGRLQAAIPSSQPLAPSSQASAPSPQPSAPSPQPSAPSPQPSAPSPQAPAPSPQPSAPRTPASTPSPQESAPSSQPSARAPNQDRGAIPRVAAESRYLILAQEYARGGGCVSPVATMNLRAGWVETFTITCATGDARTIRCDYGTCRDLK
jgi:hypothetical protein